MNNTTNTFIKKSINSFQKTFKFNALANYVNTPQLITTAPNQDKKLTKEKKLESSSHFSLADTLERVDSDEKIEIPEEFKEMIAVAKRGDPNVQFQLALKYYQVFSRKGNLIPFQAFSV